MDTSILPLPNRHWMMSKPWRLFAFGFGMTESSISTHCGMILGFEFDEKSVYAFGIQNFVKSFTIGTTSFIVSACDQQY